MVTILWRDIPAQVTATVGGRTEKALLPSRFQKAIDKAANVAGLTDRHLYIEQWRRQAQPLAAGADPADAVASEARRLDQAYDRQRLATLVAQGGVHPTVEQP